MLEGCFTPTGHEDQHRSASQVLLQAASFPWFTTSGRRSENSLHSGSSEEWVSKGLKGEEELEQPGPKEEGRKGGPPGFSVRVGF